MPMPRLRSMVRQYADHLSIKSLVYGASVFHTRRSKTWCIMKRTVNMSAWRAKKGDLLGEPTTQRHDLLRVTVGIARA